MLTRNKELKALCPYIRRNCFLMSSSVQNLNYGGYRKRGYAQYRGIVHGGMLRLNVCAFGTVCDCQVENSANFRWAAKRVRIVINKS
jgi:hypothetical protein